MTKYEVQIDIKIEKEEEWKSWMKNTHIRDVINTGLFNDFIFKKIYLNGLDIPQGYSRYVIEYFCNTREQYNEYKEKYAQRLQSEHSKKFDGYFINAKRSECDFEDVFEMEENFN